MTGRNGTYCAWLAPTRQRYTSCGCSWTRSPGELDGETEPPESKHLVGAQCATNPPRTHGPLVPPTRQAGRGAQPASQSGNRETRGHYYRTTGSHRSYVVELLCSDTNDQEYRVRRTGRPAYMDRAHSAAQERRERSTSSPGAQLWLEHGHSSVSRHDRSCMQCATLQRRTADSRVSCIK